MCGMGLIYKHRYAVDGLEGWLQCRIPQATKARVPSRDLAPRNIMRLVHSMALAANHHYTPDTSGTLLASPPPPTLRTYLPTYLPTLPRYEQVGSAHPRYSVQRQNASGARTGGGRPGAPRLHRSLSPVPLWPELTHKRSQRKTAHLRREWSRQARRSTDSSTLFRNRTDWCRRPRIDATASRPFINLRVAY